MAKNDRIYIGSADGSCYHISKDPKSMPEGALPAPLAGPPTLKQIETLTKKGATVIVAEDVEIKTGP